MRCRYCDTAYAFDRGKNLSVGEIVEQVAALGCPLVEVTGGEPLAQSGTVALLGELVEAGYTVLLETSGALPVSAVPAAVRKIMDLKCPSSGETNRNLYENIEHLHAHDEVKFVVATREDYEWAKETAARYGLSRRCHAVLFSCVFGELEPGKLAEWMLADRLSDVRLQLQLHKILWSPDARGV